MVTSINSYSVSLGMDARGYVDGAQLSRRETNLLIRDIESARTPAENFTAEQNRLSDALRKGSIELGTYNRLLQAKREQYGFADRTLKDYASSLVGPLATGLGIVTAGTIAATAAGVAFVSHMKSTQDAIDDVADSANKLGISYNELTGLRFAGQEGGGLDAGTVDASIRKVMVNISKAVDDPGNAVNKAFQRLGVNAGELMRVGPTEAVMRLADGMQGVNSQADKLALAMEIFGKSGIEMVTTLEGGRDAISEAVEFQNKWNGLTDAQVVAVGASNDAWDRISVVIDGISTKLAAEMAPAFLVITEDILKSVGGVKQLDLFMQDLVASSVYELGVLKDISEIFIALPMLLADIPMMMAGINTSTNRALDVSSGDKFLDALHQKTMELRKIAIDKEEERKKQLELLRAQEDEDRQLGMIERLSKEINDAASERIRKEEQKRTDMENALARNALQAAEKVFEKQRSDALKLRDEIAKGPGGGIMADSNEAARFLADQVNRALAADSVGVPGKPTDEQLVEIAQKEYEQSLIDSKKADDLALLVRKLVDKEPPIGRVR